MSQSHCTSNTCSAHRSTRLDQEESNLINCYRSLPSRDRYAIRCLVYAFKETNKLQPGPE